MSGIQHGIDAQKIAREKAKADHDLRVMRIKSQDERSRTRAEAERAAAKARSEDNKVLARLGWGLLACLAMVTGFAGWKGNFTIVQQLWAPLLTAVTGYLAGRRNSAVPAQLPLPIPDAPVPGERDHAPPHEGQ